MAKVTNTGAGALKLVKPDAIVVTLFAGTEADDIPKGDSYVLDDVIRDTTSIAQDDNSTSDVERETSDTPILSIVTSGKYQLAAEVADTQKDLLVALCDFTYDETTKKVYAPAAYKAKYAKVDIVFGTKAVVVPKVQLNSKVTMESLNTSVGKIALAGTAQLASLKIGASGTQKAIKTPYYLDEDYTMPTGG